MPYLIKGSGTPGVVGHQDCANRLKCDHRPGIRHGLPAVAGVVEKTNPGAAFDFEGDLGP